MSDHALQLISWIPPSFVSLSPRSIKSAGKIWKLKAHCSQHQWHTVPVKSFGRRWRNNLKLCSFSFSKLFLLSRRDLITSPPVWNACTNLRIEIFPFSVIFPSLFMRRLLCTYSSKSACEKCLTDAVYTQSQSTLLKQPWNGTDSVFCARTHN